MTEPRAARFPLVRRLAFRAAVVVCLAAVAGGGWYAWTGYRTAPRPQDPVLGYFTALADGDAAGALAYGPLPDGVSRAWLTGAVLAAQLRTARLDDVAVAASTRDGSHARVTVSYRLRFAAGDQVEHAVVPVHRAGGSWRLDAAAVPVSFVVTRAADRVSLAGAQVPTGRVLMFPGAAPVQVDTAMLQAAPAPVQVGATEPVRVILTPTAAAQHAVTAAVVRRVAACWSGARAAPDCPLPSARAVPDSLKGSVAADGQKLRVTVADDATGLLDVSGSLVVRGSYRTLNFDNTEQLRSGRITVTVDATATSTTPPRISFGSGS